MQSQNVQEAFTAHTYASKRNPLISRNGSYRVNYTMARTCHSAFSRTTHVREVRKRVATEGVRRETKERTKAKDALREVRAHLYGMAKVLALEPQSRRFPQVAKVTNHTPIVPQSQL